MSDYLGSDDRPSDPNHDWWLMHMTANCDLSPADEARRDELLRDYQDEMRNTSTGDFISGTKEDGSAD